MRTPRGPSVASKWVTAKVVEAFCAKRFINQLDFLGFDFVVQHEGRCVRILVRDKNLEEVLLSFRMLAPKSVVPKNEVRSSRIAAILLLAIPLGMFLGTFIATTLGLESQLSIPISAVGGAITGTIGILISSRR